MRPVAAVALSVSMLAAQSARPAPNQVTAVRHWSLSEVTRVAIEVSGKFEFRTDRLHDPERIYFDILDSRAWIDARSFYSETLQDKAVKRIRVAENPRNVTRVVLDLTGPLEITTSHLTNPDRLIIELRAGTAPAVPSVALPNLQSRDETTARLPGGPSRTEAIAPSRTEPVVWPPSASSRTEAAAPPSNTVARTESSGSPANAARTEPGGRPMNPPFRTDVAVSPSKTPEWTGPAASSKPSSRTETAATPAPMTEPPKMAASAPLPAANFPVASELGTAARHTSAGENSLIRALGLKIARVVIDPGHGGHDHGTEGPSGLLEKDLVLDVSKRVGKLVEDRLGAEVIYTRSDDTFVPLEGRTALANEKKADLFLSIHANSSTAIRIAGIETFYLNINGSKDALDLAARENSTAQRSIFDLPDLLEKITTHDKAEESREFASDIQNALYAFSARSIPGSRNRGVKTAPFVVLIGAKMPSVLAEIGFLSNPREETLLKKPDQRQKLAEALYRGIRKYSESLSHFQVASNP